ncbi:MAG: DUF2163 domain-containing protein [Brevundimonas sp.]|uniref:DUF2163 domain-containing protein n=1 Tax=Brevundimonas sp. TaxID=1871086 RepID=UPI0025C664C3|nr:DUF2163 domain-containing protein [Brevundimonas sp.]MBX3477201.1 DUF2163 domain-containing protein [Brevundimonas sp.]
MRILPEEMTARIESGAATLCHVWRLTRADGAVMGFTDHDRDLAVGGVTCRAASGWTAGVSETGIGTQGGAASASGGLDDGGLTEADIVAGLYDGAEIELWRVDWERPDLKVRLWRGRIRRIRREGEGFVADLDGPAAVLERVVGRTYGRLCDAVLGDARCGVNRSLFPGRDCDKTWATCRGTFDNGANFQGFPDIPGDDYLAAFPAEGGRHDGGSRRG